MTTDQAKSLAETAIAALIAALERGQSDALTAYLRTVSRFHRYSWSNVLLIHSQRPGATHVAGFQAWRRLGRWVRKGERGIVILAPMVGRKKSDDTLTEDQVTRVFGFRAAHVFDVGQTEGAPLPAFASVQGDPGAWLPRLTQFVSDQGIALTFDAGISPAKGMSLGGRITLLPDLAKGERFAVLVHELAHELLHRGERRTATTATVRETEAEAVAFVVSSAIGLDTNTACSDYIQLYAGEKTTLTESLTAIQQTASHILEALEQPASAAG